MEYPSAAPLFGSILPPRAQARLMGHAPFFFSSWYNVERAARFPKAERIINGEPTLLLSHGKFIPGALKKERVTEEEVRGAIRGEGVTRVEDVDAVTMENDGTLTVAWTSKKPG